MSLYETGIKIELKNVKDNKDSYNIKCVGLYAEGHHREFDVECKTPPDEFKYIPPETDGSNAIDDGDQEFKETWLIDLRKNKP